MPSLKHLKLECQSLVICRNSPWQMFFFVSHIPTFWWGKEDHGLPWQLASRLPPQWNTACAVATCCGYLLWLPATRFCKDCPRPLASQPSRRGNPRGARGPRRLRLPCWCEQLDAGMVARHRRTKKGRSVALSRGVCPKIWSLGSITAWTSQKIGVPLFWKQIHGKTRLNKGSYRWKMSLQPTLVDAIEQLPETFLNFRSNSLEKEATSCKLKVLFCRPFS